VINLLHDHQGRENNIQEEKMEKIDVKTEIINLNPSGFMWTILNNNKEQLSTLIIMMFADIQFKVEIINKLEEIENNAGLYPKSYLAASKFRYIESLVEMNENTKDRVLALIKENEKKEGKEKNNDDELQLMKPIDSNTQKREEAVAFEQMLFNQFADFKKHSEFLKKYGFYVLREGHLRWVHGGNLLLAAYFGMIQERPGNFTCIWANIEKAFNTKNLAQYFCDYKNIRKGKTDKYREYNKILQYLIEGRTSL
jgi:hypothetical protein